MSLVNTLHGKWAPLNCYKVKRNKIVKIVNTSLVIMGIAFSKYILKTIYYIWVGFSLNRCVWTATTFPFVCVKGVCEVKGCNDFYGTLQTPYVKRCVCVLKATLVNLAL